ncbi:MAG: glycosyltransferase family 9 protein [bacterium]
MKNHPGSNSSTVLAIRLRLLGDVLATLGTLRALKTAAPGHRLVFVVDSHYHGLLKNVGYIDMLLPQPPKFHGLSGALAYERYVEHIRNLNPTHALDFHSNTRSAILAYLSGAPVRVGFDVRIRKMLYTDVEPRAEFRNGRPLPRTSHESALALVRRSGFAGVDGPAGNTIPVTKERAAEGANALRRAGVAAAAIERGRVIGLNPGNPYPAKAWVEENWTKLAGMLTAGGRTVIVFWGPGERTVAERIVERSGGGVHLAPALALEAVPGALESLRLLVTIDSGLKHLAVAVGGPTVTLFGPTNPYEWHMGGVGDRFLYEGVSCSPCRLKECPIGQPCMRQIVPERVLEEIRAVEELDTEL